MVEEEHREQKILLEWESPERIFIKRSKKYFQNLFALLFIFAGLAIFFKEFLLAAVFGGFGFLQYVLGTVPPRGTKHRITVEGVDFAGQLHPWKELTGFWFEEREGEALLHIDTTLFFPGRLTLLLGGQSKERIASILEKYIPSKECPPKDIFDKLSEKVSRRFRLE